MPSTQPQIRGFLAMPLRIALGDGVPPRKYSRVKTASTLNMGTATAVTTAADATWSAPKRASTTGMPRMM